VYVVGLGIETRAHYILQQQRSSQALRDSRYLVGATTVRRVVTRDTSTRHDLNVTVTLGINVCAGLQAGDKSACSEGIFGSLRECIDCTLHVKCMLVHTACPGNM
jgi:hypothetical protein